MHIFMQTVYLKCLVGESNFPEFLLIWILSNISHVSQKSLERSLHFSIILLNQQQVKFTVLMSHDVTSIMTQVSARPTS